MSRQRSDLSPAPQGRRLVTRMQAAHRIGCQATTILGRAARRGVPIYGFDPRLNRGYIRDAGKVKPGEMVLLEADLPRLAGAPSNNPTPPALRLPAPERPESGFLGRNVGLGGFTYGLRIGDVRGGWWDGRWHLMDLLEAVAEQEGAGATLHLALWGAHEGAHLVRLRQLVADGRIAGIRLYTDRTLVGRYPEAARRMGELFGDELRVWSCHGKFAAFVGGALGTVFTGSANLHAHSRLEAGVIRCDAALAESVAASAEHVCAGGSTQPADLFADPDRPVYGLSSNPAGDRWDCADAVSALVDAGGPGSELTVCSHNVSPEHALRVRQMLDAGRVSALRVVVDEGIRARHKDRCRDVMGALGADGARMFPTHAKFAMVRGGARGDFLLTTSANLNRNPRIESFEVHREPALLDGWDALVSDVWGWQGPGKWKDRSKWKLAHALPLMGEQTHLFAPEKAPESPSEAISEGESGVGSGSPSEIVTEEAIDERPPVREGHREVSPEWDPCRGYAEDVLAGRVVAGPLVRAACGRHLEDLERAERLGWHFSFERWEHFRAFVERLKLWQGDFAGESVELHPWQEFVCGNLYGWLADPGDGSAPDTWPRRFRRAYLEIGKGNSKSPTMAMMALYALMEDGEEGAEVYLGAAKWDQAKIVATDAARIAQYSGWRDLQWRWHGGQCIGGNYPPTNGILRLLSRDAGKHESGIKPHMAFLDEVHEHEDGLLLEMVQRGFKFRRQPMIVMATNSGYADEPSIAKEEHDAAEQLLIGDYTDETAFAYVCGMDEGDKPFEDASCWPKANPMMDRPLMRIGEFLRQAVDHAKGFPSRRANIERLHFCRWVGASVGGWMSHELWTPMEREDGLEVLAGGDVVLAVDLSESGDMTALTWMGATGYTAEGRAEFYAVPWAYLPAEGLRQRGMEDRHPYEEYVRRGELRTTDGATVEYPDVADDVVDAIDGHGLNVLAVVYDGWRFTRFHEALDLAGMPQGMAYVDHPQNWGPRATSKLRMGASVGFLERIIRAKRLTLQRSAPMRAAVSGAVVRMSDTGQQKFSKSASTKRIDPLIALTMAAGACEWLWGESDEAP